MIQTLTTSEAAHLLLQDDNAAWSRSGAYALIEYLEEHEEESAPIEFDRVGIRCDFDEYKSILEAARQYGCDYTANMYNDDDTENENYLEETIAYCLEWLQDRTQVIQFDEGVIIQAW